MFPTGLYARQRRQPRLLGRVAALREDESGGCADPGGSRDQLETDTETTQAPAFGADGMRDDARGGFAPRGAVGERFARG